MYASLERERLDGSAFQSVPVIGQCPMNRNILDPKTGAVYRTPERKNGDYLENGPNNFN
jgi:hypothetical protein